MRRAAVVVVVVPCCRVGVTRAAALPIRVLIITSPPEGTEETSRSPYKLNQTTFPHPFLALPTGIRKFNNMTFSVSVSPLSNFWKLSEMRFKKKYFCFVL